MSSAGYAAFRLSFEISPIILVGGLAASVPGGMLPIVALTEAANFVDGLLSGGDPLDLDDFFAHYVPLPGGKLLSNQVGTYPFANQNVAANAIIQQPLAISMRMVCPARTTSFGYAARLSTIQSLQASLQQHVQQGGTFTVVTPAFIYANCLLLDMTDVSSGESKQPQIEWQLDFVQALITLQQAQEAQNALLSKISSGVPISGEPSWSSLGTTIAQPITLATSSVLGAASSLTGSSVAQAISAYTP